ncbi:MAG: D-glycero-beta-D-manno-heptose-7-phosphate kinase [Verrucomicrobia bacterium]|nr:D-glycero-beta-D-manno-heptose-7-phosphate kinase [Verrucomicrobiota bacterium]
MVKLANVFNRLQTKKVLVAGDFMLDHYLFGKSKRISPEAPVPVVCVDAEDERAGGAGNVTVNLIALGMDVVVLGRVGDDHSGATIRSVLTQKGANTHWLVTQPDYLTPKKSRVIAGSQQIVRVDFERQEPLAPVQEAALIAAIPDILQDVHLVALSDYAKGFLTTPLLRALIDAANRLNIPVIADPKGTDFQKYSGSTILKPNLSEALAVAPSSTSSLLEASKHIFNRLKCDVIMITRSEAGISLFYPDAKQEDYPVEARAVKDVTGAGDTVLAMLSCALANGVSLPEATQLANIAAQVAVEKVGCACVSLSEVAHRLITDHAHNKIFDADHFVALKQALNGRPCTIIHVDPQSEPTTALLKALRTHAASTDRELVVSLSGPAPDEELVAILTSLKEVDYILLTCQSSQHLLQDFPHEEAVTFAG